MLHLLYYKNTYLACNYQWGKNTHTTGMSYTALLKNKVYLCSGAQGSSPWIQRMYIKFKLPCAENTKYLCSKDVQILIKGNTTLSF